MKCLKNEVAYVTIENPAFCLFLYLTGGHFRGELHFGDVSEQKKQVLTNPNSRNRSCKIVRWTIDRSRFLVNHYVII